MGSWLSITALLAVAGRPSSPLPPAVQGKPHTVQARPAANNFSLTVSPAAISFSATNPDLTPVAAGSAAASVSWQNRSGNQTSEASSQ